jgi:hypothetical protein
MKKASRENKFAPTACLVLEFERVERKSHHSAIASDLLLAVILWGANNVGV